MRIPIFKPLWNLSGKIAYWLIEKSSEFWKKVGLSVSALSMSVLSVFCGMNPSLFGGIFSLHTAFAATTPNVALAEYAGNIQVNASSLNNYFNSIESFSMDVTPLIGGYFINNELTGSAIVDSNGYNIPYMPPSSNETSSWYFFQPVLMQGRTYNYTLYTGSDDLEGDIVYFPSSAGMSVNASNTLDFGSNNFSITIDGFFDANNTGTDDIIFENNEFSLEYRNGQLILSNGSGGIISSQVSTLGTYTLQNGRYSTVLNNTSNAIVTMVVNPTTLVTSSITSSVNTTSQTNSSTRSTSTELYQTIGGKVYTTQWFTTYVTFNNTTLRTANQTGITTSIDGKVPVIFGGYTTTISGNGTTTLVINEQSSSAKTLIAGVAGPNTTTSHTTYTNTSYNVTGTPITTSTTYNNVHPYYEDHVTIYTINNFTTQISSKAIGNITNINNAGKVGNRIGLMYYDVPSNTYQASWSGGDKVLTISRIGSNLTVSDGSTVLMSIPVANNPVATNGSSPWTIAQQGAMKYLRSMTINNNGTDVASWNWEKGNTFTDSTGTGNMAYPSFITSPITNGAYTTLSGYRAVNNYTSITTSTTATSASPTQSGGIIDTNTPDSDINRNIEESKWENIFLFGMFYNLAQDGGIPPSLFFIPLFGALAIIAFAVAYHFTRDMLVSGLAGNAMLGLGISMSVLYTIPLVLGLVIMFVLLVKRKTVSL